MVLSSIKPKTVNNAHSLTCISEWERKKSGGKSQKKWLISFDPQKHSRMLMSCVSEHLSSPPGKPQPWAGSTPCWTRWPHRARGCWQVCTAHRPHCQQETLRIGRDTEDQELHSNSHRRGLICSWHLGVNYSGNSRGHGRRGDRGKSTRVCASGDPS